MQILYGSTVIRSFLVVVTSMLKHKTSNRCRGWSCLGPSMKLNVEVLPMADENPYIRCIRVIRFWRLKLSFRCVPSSTVRKCI